MIEAAGAIAIAMRRERQKLFLFLKYKGFKLGTTKANNGIVINMTKLKTIVDSYSKFFSNGKNIKTDVNRRCVRRRDRINVSTSF